MYHFLDIFEYIYTDNNNTLIYNPPIINLDID